ncbi:MULTISPECIES: MarR family transcriptional regulator [unclassified Streptomyces]|uniref:MarR family transcriptional regulator n=1 Tax=unclassified Streptomyces TaxID=2593676 RepID=UPI0009A128C6|nr:MarR family transcriptional regulator [Streptomyces sp. NBRC 110465]
MAIQHFSPALPVPAVSAAYPMAKPGYGKRSAPDQQPRTPHDFALLPARERYIAGFVDHLPDGAAMSVKQLTKQLPLYGQQAIGTSLNALSVAGHLRRVRCPVGTGDETRWAFRTFWSRTARDNAWWTTYLATETAVRTAAPAAVPQQRTAPEPTSPAPEAPTPATTPAAPAAPTASSAPTAPTVGAAETAGSAGAAGMARSAGTAGMAGTAQKALPAAFSPASRFSPAYLALAELGRKDSRLALSAHDCTTLEPQAAEWLARGVTTDYLITALTAGLPTHVDCPPRFIRHRLTDKIPPHHPTPHTPPDTNTPPPTRHLLVECTDCGRPGPPQALPDGLCRPCRTTHPTNHHPPADPTQIAAVKAHMANLRHLLKAP